MVRFAVRHDGIAAPAEPDEDAGMVSEQMSQIIQASVAARERSAGQVVELGERRQRMDTGAGRLPDPAGVTVETVDTDGVRCEWTRPAVVRDQRVLLYFHGGGYANGSLTSHRKLVGHLATAIGMRALSVGYRLAPEHPYPAAVDDGARALAWLTATGVAAADVVVAGDSAGGGLAMAICLAVRERALPMPGALVLLSPWVDMTIAGTDATDDAVDDPMVTRANLEELRDWYLGGADPATPLASPARGDLAGLPPTLIQVGQRELLAADAMALHRRLLAAGVDARGDVWDGMVHVWHFFAGHAPEADAAMTAIAEWLREQRPDTVV